MVAAEEERCRRYGHPAAILVIDLNGLKRINDTQGHSAGDELIARAGGALKSAARANDIVARLGGDQFGILSCECDHDGSARLLDRVRTAFQEVDVQASIGLAMRDPLVGLAGAIETADGMMYEEKQLRNL